MEKDIFIIMGLLISAFSWWITIHVKEARKEAKQLVKDQEDRLERIERVKRLTGKLQNE